MYSPVFSMPARSLAAIGATVALAAGSMALAPAAQADSGTGHASAVILRAGLDVSLLNSNIDVPLNAYVNDVQAPADAKQTLLSAKLKGVDDGKPFDILNAQVANTKATADAKSAQGYANLVNAQVHLPGLPLLALIEVKEATSKATCEAGQAPTASSNILGDIKVLGQTVALKAGGSVNVDVPAVGNVHLGLSEKKTTSDSAAGTALQLNVVVGESRPGVNRRASPRPQLESE